LFKLGHKLAPYNFIITANNSTWRRVIQRIC
jgi:hypothetical protein